MTWCVSPKINAQDVIAFCHEHDSDLCVRGCVPESISGIALDSRKVEAGNIFVAIHGTQFDGRDYIPDAIARGAAIILTDDTEHYSDDKNAPCLLLSKQLSRLAAVLAAYLYGGQPNTQILVTGTNGKTSVAEYARQLWQSLDVQAASVGTLGVRSNISDAALFSGTVGLTSPDSILMAQILRQLHDEQIDHVCIEASSHGLDQYRLDGTTPNVAIFTGLGRDHLDYHGDLQRYLSAKVRLFSTLLTSNGVVLYAAGCVGSEEVRAIAKQRGLRILSYGIDDGDIRACDLQRRADGMCFTLRDSGKERKITLPLIGDFQCLNVLAAYGALVATGVDSDAVMVKLSQLQPVAGRMQKVGFTARGAVVYVDYAHTPDALQAVMTDMRKHLAGQLWLGFGCGGDRDAGKRAIMGQVSSTADHVVVCDDNPRTEDAALIRQQILQGNPTAQEIGNRALAIAHLCQQAKAEDVVLIAGKGHEQGQIVGKDTLPFDDVLEASKYCV